MIYRLQTDLLFRPMTGCNYDILQQISMNQNKDKALRGIMRYETPQPSVKCCR